MKSTPIIFALLTALCWGLYGPTLAESRTYLKSPFKPYLAIGVAYLVWGILGGLIGMWAKKDSFDFPALGMFWGLAAGTLGAWGALTLTLAMFKGGTSAPNVVMSIVFGGAVTVSAFVSLIQNWGKAPLKPQLLLGMVGILISAVVVAYYTPTASHGAPAQPASRAENSAPPSSPPAQ